MIRRPPRSTLDRSSAASDVYKRQAESPRVRLMPFPGGGDNRLDGGELDLPTQLGLGPVSYKHLRAHETVLDLVCRLLLEKTQT